MAIKKALSVGINIYSDPDNNLNGCVNDSLMIRELLRKHFEFDRGDIKLLLDHQATQANIETELKNLVKGAKKGDILVFHYSGHGSQVVDYSFEDEEDGYDEIICPYDMDWSNPFTDDKIAKLTKITDGVKLTMIMDCCHSGSINKNFLSQGGAFVPVKNKYLFPPTALIPNKVEKKDPKFKKRTFKQKLENRSTLISGCRDDQTSSDAWIDGAYHGAFTFYLNECLKKNKWKVITGELVKEVNEALEYHNFSQRPVLSGLPGVEKQAFIV